MGNEVQSGFEGGRGVRTVCQKGMGTGKNQKGLGKLGMGIVAGFLAGWTVLGQVRITEIMYHPAGDDPNEPGEYIELWNQGEEAVDLSGWRFDRGIQLTFPTNTILQPHAYLLVAKDPEFLKQHASLPSDLLVVGPYEGNLNNGGETIRLVNAYGQTVIRLRYGDHGDWPAAADGTGHSLVFEDFSLDPEDPRDWTASRMIGGSPGRVDNPERIPPEDLVLIQLGSIGKYFKGTEEPSGGTTDWTKIDFQTDDRWLEGPSGYGYSNNPQEQAYIKTFLDDMRGHYISVYVRLPFQLTQAQIQQIASLELVMAYDDGYVAYLNGERVHATNVEGNPPAHDDHATTSVDYQPETVDLTPFLDLLRPGTNILAVQGHNWSISGSSDFILSPTLIAHLKPLSTEQDPRRQICINEILASSGPNQGDWVELYNPTDQEIDLSGCWLSDDPAQLDKYQLPQGSTVPAHGFLVLRQQDFGFGLNAGGEKVFLTEPNKRYVLAAYGFGPQIQGVSIGRYPDGAPDWFFMPKPTPGAPNQVQRVSPVVISELMYHDPEDARYEYIELQNRGDQEVDLSQWKFRGVEFTFPDGTKLGPGEFLVVADDQEAFTERYPDVSAPVLGDYGGNLDNGGETIRLLNADDIVVDFVSYQDRPPWPVTPDGLGASLERATVVPDFTDPYQWAASPISHPSPGRPSTITGYQEPQPSPVVLTEVMYHAISETTDPRRGEFVEIYNRSKNPVDLTGWSVVGDVQFAFPEGTQLGPQQCLVLAWDPAYLKGLYSLPDSIVLGPLQGELRNGGGKVWIVRPNGRVADGVNYDDDFPWPSLADGYGKEEGKGRSLERICVDEPWGAENWRASAEDQPTPGVPPQDLVCPPPPLVTNLTLEPFPIRADSRPKLTAWVHGGERVVDGTVEFWKDDVETTGEPHQSLPLLSSSDHPEQWWVELPQFPENSIIRFRLTFQLDDGSTLQSPSSDRDVFAWHAYFVEPDVQSKYPVYHLFISSENWRKLHEWTQPGRVIGNQPNPNWNREVPAVFVARGVVYDVTVRHQGSRWNRRNGATISFPCPSHRDDGKAQVRSWRIRFPSYRDLDGMDILILQKQGGWPQHISFRMFELAGVPAPKTWWADLRINGCRYNPDAYAIERPGADLVRRWYGEVGDLFKSQGYTGNEGPWSWGDERLIIGSLNGFTESQRYKYTYDRKTRNWIASRDDDRQDLVEPLIEGLHEAKRQGKAALRAYLAEHFDVDEVLRYICTINYVGTFDDMFQNHYLYHSLRDGRWRVFPWDMDHTLGSGSYGEWNANPFRGADQARVNADPVLRQKIGNIGNRNGWWNRLKDAFFIAYQDEFVRKFLVLNNTVFAPENMDQIIEEAGALYGASEAQKQQLKDYIRARHQYLNDFLLPWVPQTPRLQITTVRHRIQIQWPAWMVGFELQSAPTLQGPWTPVPKEELTVTNDQYILRIRPQQKTLFFRLVKKETNP